MARTLEVRIVLRAQQFRSGLTGAASELNRFGVQVERSASKAAQSSKALGLASAAAGKLIILGIGGAMAVSAKAAIDFESSLTGVAKTTDLAGSAFDKANTPLAVFGQAIRNLALRTPINVNDLNRIAELGGQLGIETPNLIEFTEVIAKLGVSTNLSIEEAATGLARFANIMGTSEEDFNRLGSILVALGNNFATTESEILHFGLRIAPVGATVGATEEDVLGLAAALTSLGIPAERGGTAIQRLFISMAQAIESGSDKLDEFARTAGMTGEEFSELFRESPAKAFQAFVKGLDEINKSGQGVFGTLRALDIQEQRTIQVLLAAASGWETVADAIDEAADAGEREEALNIEAGRRFGTTASQLQLLANAFNDLRIELGGAILGSGGLAAAIDIMREFFGIITDNIDSVISMAQGLALIAGVRILVAIAGLGTKFAGLAMQLRAVRGGQDAVAVGMTRVQAAAALTNLAIAAATIGITLLVAGWVDAAIKAAELRGEVRQLNQAIEDGVDPMDALIDILREANILTEERREALTEIGIGEKDFAQAMLDSQTTAELLNDALAASGMTLKDLKRAQLDPGILFGGPGGFTDAERSLILVADLADEARLRVEGLLETKSNDLVNALFESGQAVGKTRDEMERLARQFVDLFGFEGTEAQFVSWVRKIESGGIAGSKAVRDYWGGVTDESTRGAKSFHQAIMDGTEEGVQALDDFTDAIVDSIVDFEERIAEHALDIREDILGGMPTSEDYEQIERITEEGLNKIRTAQDRYIEDVMAWQGALSFLQANMSADTVAWFESLSPPEQGAFGRMYRDEPGRFEAFANEVDANFGELIAAVGVRISSELPAVLEAGFAQAFATAREAVEATSDNLSPEQIVEGIFIAMELQMAGMAPDLATDYQNALATIFGSEESAKQFGFDIGDPVIQGIINAFKTLSERAAGVLESEARQVERDLNRVFKNESPSKMSYAVGEKVAAGLWLGFKDSMDGFDPIAMKLSSSRANQLPPIRIEGGGTSTASSYSRATTVIINNPTTEGNVMGEVALALTMGGVTDSVEGRW